MAKKDYSRELTTIDELPEHRAKTVEAGLATFQHMSHQVDELRRDITALQDDIGRKEAQVDSLKQTIRIFEEQARAYQEERDQAIADRCVYETLFASFRSMLDTFKVPITPLVREQTEEIDPKVFTARLAEGLREGLSKIDRAAGHVPYDGNGQGEHGE